MDQRLSSARALASASRNELLHALQREGASTIDVLTARTGLHQNTVREHLAKLIAADLVRREPEVRTTRGRPRMIYRATAPAEALDTPDAAERFDAAIARASFARAVIEGFGERSAQTRERAVTAGAAVGRTLGAAAPDAGAGSNGAGSDHAGSDDGELSHERQVFALEAHLDSFGFDPQWEGETLEFHLWRCPFLELAKERPDVVCGVHSGLAQGVLEQAGGEFEVAELVPFVGPEQCTLRLRRR